MEESERPKPPTRRRKTAGDGNADARAASESAGATADAGGVTSAPPVAKPMRRRIAAKTVSDTRESTVEAPNPGPTPRRTTRAPAVDKSVAEIAEPIEKPTTPRGPRATPAPRPRGAEAPRPVAGEPQREAGRAGPPEPAPSTKPIATAAPTVAPKAASPNIAKPPPASLPVTGSHTAPTPATSAAPQPARPSAPIPPRATPPARQRAQETKPPSPVPPPKPAPPAKAAPPPRAPSGNASSKSSAPADALPSFLRPATPTRATPTKSEARPADASQRSQRIVEWLVARLPSRYRSRALNYLVLMRLDRPVGALLLLWPTWWALWFAANDFPPIGTLVVFTLGVFVMRSAGCVINDYADHEWLDAHVERTRGRPMAAGRVTRREALILFASLLALAFVLVLFTNALTVGLSFVGAALAALYPFSKRVTHLAQVVLGAAFGWSIPMAFAAVTHSLPPLCWLLFLANVLFSTIYDTEYAMVDRDDDLRVGAKSTAILFGDADRAIVGVLMATFLFAMLLAGQRAMLHWPYFVGLALAAAGFAWQQWTMRDRSRAHCFAAFRNNNGVGLALWVGLVLALAMR